jgi:hypothetical protein
MFEQIAYYENVASLSQNLKKGRYLFLVAEKTDISSLSSLKNIAFVGAIFPRVIFGLHTYDSGIVTAKISDSTSYKIVSMDYLSPIEIPQDVQSVLTFIDGYSIGTERFVETLYSQLPERTRIIGAGAGKTHMDISTPVLFDNEQLYTNYAIVFFFQKTISLGVKHGWKNVMGPFIATHCNGHVLEKINYHDALDIYRSSIEKITHSDVSKSPFFSFAPHFPLGIVRFNKDCVIRKPLSTNGKHLILNAPLDPNSVITIMYAQPADMITAAKEAALIARDEQPSLISSILVLDCFSRYVLLGKDFSQEIRAIADVYQEKAPLWGVLSFGEIANDHQENIEFYHNTCVVGALS